MTNPETPKDGDFASYLDAKTQQRAPAAAPPPQTIEQVIVDGDEPTAEFLEEWKALQDAPELSDEEFERQALEAPGDDGDPSTPE